MQFEPASQPEAGEFRTALIDSCGAVSRAVEKYEEEKSPSSLDSLLYHSNRLYRLLLASSGEEELEQVGRSISLLLELEELLGDSSHSASSVRRHSPRGRGRPKFDICKEQIEHLLKLNFSCLKIASLLGVSLRTLRRRMTDYDLSVTGLYSDINDRDLKGVVREIQSSFPNCGYRMMDGHLRLRGIRVTQARIRNCMHAVDPEGVALRWRQAIQRRKYRVAGPLALWHIDGNHKLIRYVYIILPPL